MAKKFKYSEISIHAAREGGDGTICTELGYIKAFQSTPPVKAATLSARVYLSPCRFQSTPPVKAATQKEVNPEMFTRFQSTPPVKAATQQLSEIEQRERISIHAAREGGDVSSRSISYDVIAFQSTPPVKAATSTYTPCGCSRAFQSTPPVKAATQSQMLYCLHCRFQSTPPVKAATAETNRRNQHFRKQQV